MRNLLNDETRLGQLKVRYGLKIAKPGVINKYIRQVRLEKACKDYIYNRLPDAPEHREKLHSEATDYIRRYRVDTLIHVHFNLEKEGFSVNILFDHEGVQNKELRKKLLSL